MSASEEFLGADFLEHAIVHPVYDYISAIEELRDSHSGVPHISFDLDILRRPTVNRKTFDLFVIQR